MNGLPQSLLGRLRIDEVFVRFDGPRLFSAVNEAGQRYIALFAEETEEAEVFLYAPVSEDRYRAIRSGSLPLRAAFSDAQDGRVFVVTSSTDEVDQRVEEWAAVRVPADWLPDDDATLGVPTPTLAPFQPNDLILRAEAIGRTIAAVELEATSVRTEYPLRSLGEVMQLVQDNVDAFAQEIAGKATQAGPVQQDILSDVELAFVGAEAASFVLLVTSRAESQLFEAPLVHSAFERLAEVVEAGHDELQLREALASLHTRAIGRYRDLLEELEDVGSGISVYVASVGRELIQADLTREEVVNNLHVVRESQAVPAEVLDVEGILIGVNVRTRVFELLDESTNQRYSGKVIEQARNEIFGLTTGERYRASILREVEYSTLTGEPKFKHRLRHIEPASSAGDRLEPRE